MKLKLNLKYCITVILIIILDQLSKMLIINNNIAFIQNTKGAFGIGNKYIILTFSIIIIIGIIAYLIKERSKIQNYIPFVLILSGAIGNLIDRLFRGYVVDFININIFNFPNFNIADICIVIGIIILIIDMLKNKFEIKSNKS